MLPRLAGYAQRHRRQHLRKGGGRLKKRSLLRLETPDIRPQAGLLRRLYLIRKRVQLNSEDISECGASSSPRARALRTFRAYRRRTASIPAQSSGRAKRFRVGIPIWHLVAHAQKTHHNDPHVCLKPRHARALESSVLRTSGRIGKKQRRAHEHDEARCISQVDLFDVQELRARIHKQGHLRQLVMAFHAGFLAKREPCLRACTLTN